MVRGGAILCYVCSQPSIQADKPTSRAALSGPAAFDPTALVIFGGGGHGKTIIDLVRAMGTYRIVGVFDDRLPMGSDVLGAPVLGGTRDLSEWRARGVHLAVNAVGGIGNVAARIKIFEILAQAGFAFPVLVHPSAVVERSATLEAGVQVCAQAYIGSAARVGFGALINTGAIVHHDCVLGRVVNLSPGATLAGNVRVENYAQLGMLATVNMQITVGEGALLGNGCTVKADVPAGTRVRAGTIWPIPKPNNEYPAR
jgi:sugar O-acyltransferase (sialic acid O-acetyltransferase NeuD family)